MADVGVKPMCYYEMHAITADTTVLSFKVYWQGSDLPEEQKQGMLQAVMVNMELLKKYCVDS